MADDPEKAEIEFEIDFGNTKKETEAINKKIHGIGQNLKSSFSGVGSSLSNVFSGIKNKLSGMMSDIKQGIGQGIGQYIGQGVSGIISKTISAPIDMIGERLSKLKTARETMRDLEGQQKRLIDMNAKLGYTVSGSIQQYMDLKIQMEKLLWQNRNLTDEDKRRESAIQKVRDCYISMKETITDMMMSVIDVALPYLDKMTQTLEVYLPKAIGTCMGVMKNLPGIWENATELMQLAVEKLSNILSYAFTDYMPKLVVYFTKRVQTIMGDGFSIESLGMSILKSIASICRSIFDMFVRLGTSIANIFGTLGKNAWDMFTGKKNFNELGNGVLDSASSAFDFNVDPYTGQRKKKQDSEKDSMPSWEREKSKNEVDLEKKMGGLFDKIGKDADDSTKWAQVQLERNKEFQRQSTSGENAPITQTEVNRQNMQRQQATTSDVIGAYMRINNAVTNRNPAIMAADKQIANQKQIAADQAKRDNEHLKKLDGVEKAIRETSKNNRGLAVVAAD